MADSEEGFSSHLTNCSRFLHDAPQMPPPPSEDKINGLTESDFILAAKIDKLYQTCLSALVRSSRNKIAITYCSFAYSPWLASRRTLATSRHRNLEGLVVMFRISRGMLTLTGPRNTSISRQTWFRGLVVDLQEQCW
jgi:hypothetical protein